MWPTLTLTLTLALGFEPCVAYREAEHAIRCVVLVRVRGRARVRLGLGLGLGLESGLGLGLRRVGLSLAPLVLGSSPVW